MSLILTCSLYARFTVFCWVALIAHLQCFFLGFNAYECARVFHKLMFRLGYKKYYVAGGDWGSLISCAMAMLYPRFVHWII